LIFPLKQGKTFKLAIVALDEIRPHEKTIRPLVELIKGDIKGTGYQRDPVLADSKTHLVLDGMHRIKALKLLGAKYVVCAEYDYSDDSVKLDRWLRTIVKPNSNLVSEIVSNFDMVLSSSFRTALRKVESGMSRIALLSLNESFVGNSRWKMSNLFQRISLIDRLCNKQNIEMRFSSKSVKSTLLSSKWAAVIYPARISKDYVLKKAMRRELLPYKTTRYIVPLRPMGVNFPISLLKESSLSECNKRLEHIVNFSKVTLGRKNVFYEGRRYSDRIAIFHKPS
jgi:hypothetical protein